MYVPERKIAVDILRDADELIPQTELEPEQRMLAIAMLESFRSCFLGYSELLVY